jgi:hypothetical protein
MPDNTKEPPAWARSTPGPSTYSLVMYDSDGDNKQEINDLTHEEFIALKRHLCDLRGIPVPESIGEE